MRRGTLSALPKEGPMAYRIAGIDVHKKMLAVVVADVDVDGDFHFERQKVGTTPADLRGLAAWLVEHEVEEVVMESTAQYWRPGWEALEQHWRPRRRAREGAAPVSGTLHLAQAQSNRGPGGRKKDFPDAERLVKRLVAQELTLSFVPDTEQRLWRTVTRKKYQLRCDRIRLQNQLESAARGRAPQRVDQGFGHAGDLCRRVPSDRPSPRTGPSHRRDHPPVVPTDLEDPARARPLRRARPVR